MDEEPHRVQRVGRCQNSGVHQDAPHAQKRDADEPDGGNWPEDPTHLLGAVLLDPEQSGDDRHGNPQHVRLEPGRGLLYRQPLHRSQHRDRWRDHAVTIEQRRPKQPQRQKHCMPARCPGPRSDKRQERKDAAFTLVVGPEHEPDVLEAHHEVDGPEDERHHPENVVVRRRHAPVASVGLLQRIQRAGADVTVHNPQRPQGEERELLPVLRLGMVSGVGAHAAPSGAGRRRRSSRARMNIRVTITADPTHQRQMAWMTNSSSQVR